MLTYHLRTTQQTHHHIQNVKVSIEKKNGGKANGTSVPFQCLDFATFLLILGGNIQENPGPVKYPLLDLFEASLLKSDGTILWWMSPINGCIVFVPQLLRFNNYEQYQLQVEFHWLCLRCLAESLPFVDCSWLSWKSFLASDLPLSLVDHQVCVSTFLVSSFYILLLLTDQWMSRKHSHTGIPGIKFPKMSKSQALAGARSSFLVITDNGSSETFS